MRRIRGRSQWSIQKQINGDLRWGRWKYNPSQQPILTRYLAWDGAAAHRTGGTRVQLAHTHTHAHAHTRSDGLSEMHELRRKTKMHLKPLTSHTIIRFMVASDKNSRTFTTKEFPVHKNYWPALPAGTGCYVRLVYLTRPDPSPRLLILWEERTQANVHCNFPSEGQDEHDGEGPNETEILRGSQQSRVLPREVMAKVQFQIATSSSLCLRIDYHPRVKHNSIKRQPFCSGRFYREFKVTLCHSAGEQSMFMNYKYSSFKPTFQSLQDYRQICWFKRDRIWRWICFLQVLSPSQPWHSIREI